MPEQAGFWANGVRLWHTVRWLRPVQVWGRIWFRFYKPTPDKRPAPALRPVSGAWLFCRRRASMVGPTTFDFIGQYRDVAADGRIEWDHPDWSRLWRYNLHYFDDLAADDAAGRREWHEQLIQHWVADNPAGRGTGWEPYPTSLRIVNWIKWALAAEPGGKSQVPLPPAALDSLATQARWLRRRLEIHLLGNHLWANAKALVFAGAFFDGPEARGWLGKGLALMDREVKEQILPDGGHFERSPMYHAILLEDLLDLVQLGDRYPGVLPGAVHEHWQGVAGRMLAWLRVMTHPDGGPAFFNDSALGIAPEFGALNAYCAELCQTASRRLPILEAGRVEADDSLIVLPDSGYARLACGPAVLLADIGPVGPDYLPGHAHADTFSFELSLRGRRVIVNSGTSTYTAGAERLRQRGTAAHNTVLVDGMDSSEVWSSFRVGRRARPLDVRWGIDADGALWLQAAHDGYKRLPGRVVHRREWRLDPTGLRIIDRLWGQARRAEARFHLHPSTSPAEIGADIRKFQLDESSWHPRFGESLPNLVLIRRFAGCNHQETCFTWSASN